MMRFFARHRNALLIAALLAGMMLVYSGNKLAGWVSPQTAYYNAGLTAYTNGDMTKAVQYFDRSIAAYKAEIKAGWLHRFIYPRPSMEYAALANFHKGKALLQARQGEQAVAALKESVRINPGDVYDENGQVTALYSPFTAAERRRLREEAMQVQYDLEMLFKSRPDLAQQEGKGKDGKGKPGKQGAKPAPGQEPGTQPGKGRPDDI